MQSVVCTWQGMAKEYDGDLDFALDFLEFAEILWGEEIYNAIDNWMI